MNLKRYREALRNIEAGKVYTFAELQNAISAGPASYIIDDLVAIGKIERGLHPVLDARGYKLKQ